MTRRKAIERLPVAQASNQTEDAQPLRPVSARSSLASYLWLSFILSPFIAALFFFFFSGRHYAELDPLAESLAPITKPVVDLFRQPSITLSDGTTINRRELPVTGRIALEDLVLFVNFCSAAMQVLLVLFLALFRRRQIIERSLRLRGVTPAQSLRSLIRSLGWKALTLPAIAACQLWALFGSPLAFYFIGLPARGADDPMNFLMISAVFFTLLGISIASSLFVAFLLTMRQ